MTNAYEYESLLLTCKGYVNDLTPNAFRVYCPFFHATCDCSRNNEDGCTIFRFTQDCARSRVCVHPVLFLVQQLTACLPLETCFVRALFITHFGAVCRCTPVQRSADESDICWLPHKDLIGDEGETQRGLALEGARVLSEVSSSEEKLMQNESLCSAAAPGFFGAFF